jgi:hypothetical protein
MKILRKESKVVLVEFGDLVYCKFINFRDDDSFLLLHKNDINEQDLLKEKCPNTEKRYFEYTDTYLDHYKNHARWQYDYEKGYIKDPISSLEAGKLQNIFRSSTGQDGFIYHLNGNPVVRKLHLEFWESYYPDLNQLKHDLEARKEWSDIKFEKTPGYNVDIIGKRQLVARYNPTQDELSDWILKRPHIKYPTVDIEDSYGVIHGFSYIKKYYRQTS